MKEHKDTCCFCGGKGTTQITIAEMKCSACKGTGLMTWIKVPWWKRIWECIERLWN